MTKSRGNVGVLKYNIVCFSGDMRVCLFVLVFVHYHKEFMGGHPGDAGLSSNVRCVCNAFQLRLRLLPVLLFVCLQRAVPARVSTKDRDTAQISIPSQMV